MEPVNLGPVVRCLNSSCRTTARIGGTAGSTSRHPPSEVICWKERLTFGKALCLSIMYHPLSLQPRLFSFNGRGKSLRSPEHLTHLLIALGVAGRVRC